MNYNVPHFFVEETGTKTAKITETKKASTTKEIKRTKTSPTRGETRS